MPTYTKSICTRKTSSERNITNTNCQRKIHTNKQVTIEKSILIYVNQTARMKQGQRHKLHEHTNSLMNGIDKITNTIHTPTMDYSTCQLEDTNN